MICAVGDWKGKIKLGFRQLGFAWLICSVSGNTVLRIPVFVAVQNLK